jgi:hypothetical protein
VVTDVALTVAELAAVVVVPVAPPVVVVADATEHRRHRSGGATAPRPLKPSMRRRVGCCSSSWLIAISCVLPAFCAAVG